MKHILRLFTNNLPFKIVSLLIAIVIWYMVVYQNDPKQTESFQVHITVQNESYIANGKQQYKIDEQYKTVTVYVTGNRSQLQDVSSEDIEVFADLTQIVDLERDPVVVPLSVTCRGIDATALSLSRATIPIEIENVASKELQINASTGDSTVNKDYEIGKLTVDPGSVTIYGPESVIENIESVVALINVDDLAIDRTLPGKLVFYAQDHSIISESVIEDDITFEGGEPVVAVAVDLWEKVSDVTLEVEYSGEPLEGYQITNINTTPGTLTLAGTDAALARLSAAGNKIIIPAEMINVTDIALDMQTEVNVADLLPEGTKLASTMNDTVIVYITVLPNGSMEYLFDVDSIAVNNLSYRLSLSYDKQEITLRITGSDEDLSKLTDSSIQVSIDLFGKTVGDYTVPLTVILPDGCSLVEEAEVSIHIKERAEKETSATTS